MFSALPESRLSAQEYSFWSSWVKRGSERSERTPSFPHDPHQTGVNYEFRNSDAQNLSIIQALPLVVTVLIAR